MHTLAKVALAALLWMVICHPSSAGAKEPLAGREILRALTVINDGHIREALAAPPAGSADSANSRITGAELMVLAAAFVSPDSRFFHDGRLVQRIGQLANSLHRSQLPDGLFDLGNLDSPPDTSFILKTLCKAQLFLERDSSETTTAIRGRIKGLILSAAEGVRTGGVHTPNHRWAVCTSLAHVNALYPETKYVDRIDEWLAEGIDLDEDGQYAERSPNYSAEVTNPALVELAILLKRPQLLEFVRKNLTMTVYHAELNGEVETIASRRQDQRGPHIYIWEYYIPYRYLAIHDGNGEFAAMARRIEQEFLSELGTDSTNMNSALTCMLEFPELMKALPPPTPLPDNFARIFPRTAMARIRRGAVTATIFGGSDIHSRLGIGSGLSTNPTFFKLRNGDAILESVRMTPAFFRTGFFYSEGLRADGDTYYLGQTLKVPYHLPLPKEYRNDNGDYRLSYDGRIFGKMDFERRPADEKILRSEVTITENGGVFELQFNVSRYENIPVTIELCFRKGGTLAGVVPIDSSGRASGPDGAAKSSDTFILKEGYGSYTVGDDRIEFGPGGLVQPPSGMDGETYTYVNGSLPVDGWRVYLTGRTPFRHTLTFRPARVR